MPQKLIFSIPRAGLDHTVKAHVFTGVDQAVYVELDGGPFNDCGLSMAGLDAMIDMLQAVRGAAQAEGWEPYV